MEQQDGQRTRVAIAEGDGIGPEIMEATLQILEAAGAELEYDELQVGEALNRQGHTSGIHPDAWDTIRRSGVLLKGPITPPRAARRPLTRPPRAQLEEAAGPVGWRLKLVTNRRQGLPGRGCPRRSSLTLAVTFRARGRRC